MILIFKTVLVLLLIIFSIILFTYNLIDILFDETNYFIGYSIRYLLLIEKLAQKLFSQVFHNYLKNKI